MAHGLTSRVYESVSDVPSSLWNRVVPDSDVFMRLPMMRAYELGWGHRKPIWPVLVFDKCGRPQAATCFFGHTVNMATMGNRVSRKLAQLGRRFYRGFMHVNTLMVGIPMPAGVGGLRIAPGADQQAVAAEFSDVLRQVAWERWFQAIALKDVDGVGITDHAAFEEHGFLSAPAPAMNVVSIRHANLHEWLTSLRSHYRYAWRKTMNKFDAQGYRCEHFVGDEILERYDRKMHRLYTSLAERQQLCLERMPRRFFKHLVMACGERVHMTAVYDGTNCIAFCWALLHNGIYQNLLCGFDERLNRQSDLYFNLALRDMAYGMQFRPKEVWLGQTADEFKARLGAELVPRQMHIRCIKPVTMALKALRPWVFPRSSKFDPRQPHRRPAVQPASETACSPEAADHLELIHA